MRCRAPRKAPRRPKQTAPIDQDLVDLAAVIAEHSLENNAAGWFLMPWLDGWNAAALATMVAITESRGGVVDWLSKTIASQSVSPEMYWIAGDLIQETNNRYAKAALRCLQVFVANSSGGGHAYNAILIPAFMYANAEDVDEYILECRCLDSIGTRASLRGDADDRLRAAFRTAWSRGLYKAAYSLPRAKPPTRKL